MPDLQKRAEDERRAAEAERKAAEERALEVIALKKQVSALEVIKDEATSKVAFLELQNRDVEAVQSKVQQLEEALAEMQKADSVKREAAEEELERVKSEKVALEEALKRDLELKLEAANRPWYKRIFSAG